MLCSPVMRDTVNIGQRGAATLGKM